MTDREKHMIEQLGLSEEDFESVEVTTADMAYVNSELALAMLEMIMEG